jgi:hypothetical protein
MNDSTPSKMIARKLCYFPADHNVEGVALPRSILENTSITALTTVALSKGPFLRKSNERALGEEVAERLAIRPRRPKAVQHPHFPSSLVPYNPSKVGDWVAAPRRCYPWAILAKDRVVRSNGQTIAVYHVISCNDCVAARARRYYKMS